MDAQTQKAGACVFIAITMVLCYPSLHSEIMALSGGVIHTAIQIVLPIAWMLGIMTALSMAGYVLVKG